MSNEKKAKEIKISPGCFIIIIIMILVGICTRSNIHHKNLYEVNDTIYVKQIPQITE